MSSEELGILARIARALFPEDVPTRNEEMFFEAFPNFPQDGWRQREGVWLSKAASPHLGQGIRGAKLIVHVPGLLADPYTIARAARGVLPDSHTTRDILADPGVNAAMGDRWVVFREGVVAMRTGEASADDLIALVRAIEEARRRPWVALAKAMSLRIDERALAIEGDTGGLLGLRESFDVRIREERRYTRIRVALPPGFPPDFSVRPGVPGKGEGIGHPILDRKLVFRGVSRRFRQQVRSVDEALLHLIGDRAESDIDAKRIRIVMPGRVLSELESLVEGALTVARALQP